MSAALKASAVPISGFGAPARTATPTRDSITLVPPPAATRPSLTKSPIVSSSMMRRSMPAPALSSLRVSGAPWNLIVTLCPLACSKTGMSAPMTCGMGPWVLTTLISAAAAVPAKSALKQPAAAKAMIVRAVLMMSSEDCLSTFAIGIAVSACRRLHPALAHETFVLGRAHELDHGGRHVLLLRDREHAGGERIVLLQLRRQHPAQFGPGDRQDDVDLLQRDLDLATRHRLRGREPVEEFGARLELIGEAEILDDLRHHETAAGGRIADRFGIKHRALEGLDRAQVELGGARLYGDADAGAGEIDARPHDLAALDEVVDDGGIERHHVGGRAGIDLGERVGVEDRVDLVSGRALESGREIAHPGNDAHAAQHRDLGRLRGLLAPHCQHGEAGRPQHVRQPRHDALPDCLFGLVRERGNARFMAWRAPRRSCARA